MVVIVAFDRFFEAAEHFFSAQPIKVDPDVEFTPFAICIKPDRVFYGYSADAPDFVKGNLKGDRNVDAAGAYELVRDFAHAFFDLKLLGLGLHLPEGQIDGSY